MHYKLLFPSEYVGAHDLNGKDCAVTIATVSVEELTMEGGIKERKPVVTFTDAKKKLILNKTNAKTVAKLYGADTEAWKGKRIILYPTKTKCGRETVDCLRIRDRIPAGTAPAPRQERTAPANGQRVVTMPYRIVTDGDGLHALTYFDGPEGRFRVDDDDLIQTARDAHEQRGPDVEADFTLDGDVVVAVDVP